MFLDLIYIEPVYWDNTDKLRQSKSGIRVVQICDLNVLSVQLSSKKLGSINHESC